jgi:hypothetical protein
MEVNFLISKEGIYAIKELIDSCLRRRKMSVS